MKITRDTNEWHKSFYGLIEIPCSGNFYLCVIFCHFKNGFDKMMDLHKSYTKSYFCENMQKRRKFILSSSVRFVCVYDLNYT